MSSYYEALLLYCVFNEKDSNADTDLKGIIGFIDYIDHSILSYSEFESCCIQLFLKGLIKQENKKLLPAESFCNWWAQKFNSKKISLSKKLKEIERFIESFETYNEGTFVSEYLKRIDYINIISPTVEVLFAIHKQHVFNIPFENLDVYYHLPIVLKKDKIYNKVIANCRGGFCYELNFLFNELLNKIGFQSRIISASIFNGDLAGPPFDHMAVLININNKNFIADVGYGDLILTPLELNVNEIQNDGRKYFKIEKVEEGFLLLMSEEGKTFDKKYGFNLSECHIEDFNELCHHKQIHPESYFLKNLVCTKPTEQGRITIFNNKFSVKLLKRKKEEIIEDDESLIKYLKEKFQIEIKDVFDFKLNFTEEDFAFTKDKYLNK